MATNPFMSQPCPYTQNHERNISNLIAIDDFNFMFATTSGFCLFNTKDNTWTRLKANIFIHPSIHHPSISIAYDESSKDVFISVFGKNKIFNIARNKLQETPSAGCTTKLICINSVCHAIGKNSYLGNHLQTFNDTTQQWENVDAFNNSLDGYVADGIIFIPKRKELLVFGGWDLWNSIQVDVIYRYNISSGKSEKLDTKLPQRMSQFGHVITNDQRFIIIIGGYGAGVGDTGLDTIYILNLDSMEFRQSRVSLPFCGECRAIIMENKDESDKLVHGFIRNEMNKYDMNIPFALIALIGIRNSALVYIHVMNRNGGQHWKVNVDKLLN